MFTANTPIVIFFSSFYLEKWYKNNLDFHFKYTCFANQSADKKVTG